MPPDRPNRNCWPVPIWPASSRSSPPPTSRKNSPSRHVPDFIQLVLLGKISPRGPLALRPGFGRARSRGFDLSQRRAVLSGVLRDVAIGLGGGMVRSNREGGRRARGAV